MGKDNLELLRNTLLVMLLLLLAFVLYKRMLILMGKNEIRKRYVAFSENCQSLIVNHRKIRIESQMEQEVTLDLHTADGILLKPVFHGKLEAGSHDLEIPAGLASGKYYVQLSTANQKDSLFFTLT